jgi:hypothetical protein
MNTNNLLLHIPFTDQLNAAYSAGDGNCVIPEDTVEIPVLTRHDGVRSGVRLIRDIYLCYPIENNFNRNTGTVMMWFKPEFDADCFDNIVSRESVEKRGVILWDICIEEGSAVPKDPSQRFSIVYPYPAATKERGEGAVNRWRFCISTNRHLYEIGTVKRRKGIRTRQSVFSTKQSFKRGSWLHLAFAWNSQKAYICINGVVDKEQELPEGVPDKKFPEYMTIGAEHTWMNYSAGGTISDFRIYDGILTESEVKKIMAES